MRVRDLPRLILFVGLVLPAGSIVLGQTYPDRPLRIVTNAAGSGTDFIARIIAQGMSGSLGQQVVVENRGSVVGADIVSKATPDGYTLLIDTASLWLATLLQKVPYDPIRDFAPVSQLAASPLILVTSPSLGLNSVADLIGLAKAKPGSVNYATGSTGGSGHLSGELFKSMAGINIVRVAYKGSVLALTDLISGTVHMGFDNPSTLLPLIKAGKLKALAVTSLQASSLLPGFPTVSATVPGYEYVSTNGLYVPANTPVSIIRRLNQETLRVLGQPEVKEKFIIIGSESAGNSPEQFAASIKSNIAKWGTVIRDAGIRLD